MIQKLNAIYFDKYEYKNLRELNLNYPSYNFKYQWNKFFSQAFSISFLLGWIINCYSVDSFHYVDNQVPFHPNYQCGMIVALILHDSATKNRLEDDWINIIISSSLFW